MDPTDVARLRAHPERLQARVKRQEEARKFRVLAPLLRAAGLRRLSRLPARRIREVAGGRLSLPGRDERFYWPEIPDGTCVPWRGPGERDRIFAEALAACFAPSERLLFIFHTAESALVLGCADAIAHAGVVLDHACGGLWVISRSGAPGLVEVSLSDDEVCWRLT
jgi:hypothetical protein